MLSIAFINDNKSTLNDNKNKLNLPIIAFVCCSLGDFHDVSSQICLRLSFTSLKSASAFKFHKFTKLGNSSFLVHTPWAWIRTGAFGQNKIDFFFDRKNLSDIPTSRFKKWYGRTDGLTALNLPSRCLYFYCEFWKCVAKHPHIQTMCLKPRKQYSNVEVKIVKRNLFIKSGLIQFPLRVVCLDHKPEVVAEVVGSLRDSKFIVFPDTWYLSFLLHQPGNFTPKR